MVPRQLPPEGSKEEQLSDSISSKNLKWPIGMARWDPWQHHAAIIHCHTQGRSQQAGHLAGAGMRQEGAPLCWRSAPLVSHPTPKTQATGTSNCCRELPTPRMVLVSVPVLAGTVSPTWLCLPCDQWACPSSSGWSTW